MATFEQPSAFSKHNTYVTLLKKALLHVKPDHVMKFVYFKDFVFADNKRLQCVLVDYSPQCVDALKAARRLPTAEGTVSLTSQDELKFEPTKGRFKSIWLKKYFATMGDGIKAVWVDPNEVDDEAAGTKPFQLATPPAGKVVQRKDVPPPAAANPVPPTRPNAARPTADVPSPSQAKAAPSRGEKPAEPWTPAKEEAQKQFPPGLAAKFKKQVSSFLGGTDKSYGLVLDAWKAVEEDPCNSAKLATLHASAQAYIEHYSKDLKPTEQKNKENVAKLDTAILLQQKVKTVESKNKTASESMRQESLTIKKWVECSKWQLEQKNPPNAGDWAKFQFAAGQTAHRIEQFLELEEKGDFENAAKVAAGVDQQLSDLKKQFAALDGSKVESLLNQKAKDEVSEDHIADLLKRNGELTSVIAMFAETSTNPGLKGIQAPCKNFRSGGNKYIQAKSDVAAGNFLDAKMKVEQTNAQVAKYLGIWKKAWDPMEVADFKQRTADKSQNEAKLAHTIGEVDYLQKMLVIKKILEKNGIDPANHPLKLEDAVALFGYTTEDYNMLNPILRGYRPKHKKAVPAEEWEQVKKSYEVYIASMNNGLQKLPPVAGWVFRGTPLDVLDKISGGSFSDKAFVSSSSTKSFRGDMQWIIKSGGIGRDVTQLSLYPEGEVLFPSGTRFSVQSLVAAVDANDPDYAAIAKVVKDADRFPTLEALHKANPSVAAHDSILSKVNGKVFVVMTAG